MRTRVLILLTTVTGLAHAPQATAQQRSPFLIAAMEARPGETVSGFIEVPAGVDEGTRIPVSIVHGSRPGPVLAAIAGVHSYEYPPISALQRTAILLRGTHDDKRVARTYVILRVS